MLSANGLAVRRYVIRRLVNARMAGFLRRKLLPRATGGFDCQPGRNTLGSLIGPDTDRAGTGAAERLRPGQRVRRTGVYGPGRAAPRITASAARTIDHRAGTRRTVPGRAPRGVTRDAACRVLSRGSRRPGPVPPPPRPGVRLRDATCPHAAGAISRRPAPLTGTPQFPVGPHAPGERITRRPEA